MLAQEIVIKSSIKKSEESKYRKIELTLATVDNKNKFQRGLVKCFLGKEPVIKDEWIIFENKKSMIELGIMFTFSDLKVKFNILSKPSFLLSDLISNLEVVYKLQGNEIIVLFDCNSPSFFQTKKNSRASPTILLNLYLTLKKSNTQFQSDSHVLPFRKHYSHLPKKLNLKEKSNSNTKLTGTLTNANNSTPTVESKSESNPEFINIDDFFA